MSISERIKLGETKLIRTDKDIPITMDGSLSSIKQENGVVRYFATDLGEKPNFRIFEGTASDPFVKQTSTFEWDFNEYPSEYPCGLWAQSIYKCDDGMLIGFTHREDFSRIDTTSMINYHIGLGVSHNGGKNWFYAGDICGTPLNYIPKVHANMAGCPTIVKDGYFQVFFNEFSIDGTRVISAARFSVDETVEKLKKGKLPKVFKYSGNGKWDTPGIGGKGAAIVTHKEYESIMKMQIANNDKVIQTGNGVIFPGHSTYLDSHSKATYCEPLGCYLLTLHVYGAGLLLLYLSEDGINWNEYITVDKIPESYGSGYTQHYSTFVDISGKGRDDSFTVGDRFLLHIVRKNMNNYPDDEYLVREISII